MVRAYRKASKECCETCGEWTRAGNMEGDTFGWCHAFGDPSEGLIKVGGVRRFVDEAQAYAYGHVLTRPWFYCSMHEHKNTEKV